MKSLLTNYESLMSFPTQIRSKRSISKKHLSKPMMQASMTLMLIFTAFVAFANDCTGFRTQTQGGWGANPNGNNPGVYNHANFASAFPTGLTIGCGGNTLTLTTAQSVTDFLPSGSTPSTLPAGSMTDPGDDYSNVFAGQLVTTTLNVGFDLYDPNFGTNSTHLQDLVISSGTFAGWTVSQLLTEANNLIGGCSSSYSESSLNDALDDINNNYDDGTSNGGFLHCGNTPLSCSIDQTHIISCHGDHNGEATVTAVGGVIQYSYLWSNGQTTQTATGLGEGTYNVTVTDDDGATTSCSVTLTAPSEISVTETHISVLVNGGSNGSIDVTVSGGTGAYSYLWNDGTITQDRSGLPAGSYTVTVTDEHGCSKSKTIIISQPDPLSCSAVETHTISCNSDHNGEATVTASGGVIEYTYLWSNGQTTQTATGLGEGTYNVTVTDDNGATTSCSATLTAPSKITTEESHVSVSIFGGSDGSIDITANGGTGSYTYLWNDGATTEDRTELIAGTYTVTVTDENGCLNAKTIIISEPQCNCVAPTEFTVDSLSAAAAQICWNEIPCATGYILQWKNSVKSKWITQIVPQGSNCTVFSNQYPLSFDIRVATTCQDGSTTPYGSTYVFHTFPSCLPPTALYTNTIKSTKATAHWTRASDGATQTLRYRKTGTTAFITKTPGATVSSFVIKNLLPSTGYEWQIRANCSGAGKSIQGEFSPLSYFTTTSLKMVEESYVSNISSMQIYPNPASHNLTVDLQFENSQDQSGIIRVTNMLGQVIEEHTTLVNGNHLVENITLPDGISDGVYTVTVIVNGNAFHQQLVVQK